MSRAGWPIRTPRLLMRPPEAADLAPLYAIATTPSVARMLLLFRPGMDRGAFARHFPLGADRPPFRLAVAYRDRVIGSIGMGDGATPPVYYFLAPDKAGQGLGGEMLAGFLAAVDECFAPAVLTAEVFEDNPVSARLLQRNGFRVGGRRTLVSAGRPGPAPGMWLERRR